MSLRMVISEAHTPSPRCPDTCVHLGLPVFWVVYSDGKRITGEANTHDEARAAAVSALTSGVDSGPADS